MRTDARSIFLVALLLFVAVTGWRVWVALRPRPEPDPRPVAAEGPKLSSFRPLGVINLVSNQFAAQTLIVPVNPFRPTFEAMVRNPESGDLQAVVAGAPAGGGSAGDGGGRPGHGAGPNWSRRPRDLQQRGGAPPAADGTPPGPPPVPKYAFRGMFKRPDGRIAAYVTSTVGGGRFLQAGDKLGSAEVVEATADGILLRLETGATRLLADGAAPVELEGD